jgi:hypothetical protein
MLPICSFHSFGCDVFLYGNRVIGVASLLPFLGISSLDFGPLTTAAFFLGAYFKLSPTGVRPADLSNPQPNTTQHYEEQHSYPIPPVLAGPARAAWKLRGAVDPGTLLCTKPSASLSVVVPAFFGDRPDVPLQERRLLDKALTARVVDDLDGSLLSKISWTGTRFRPMQSCRDLKNWQVFRARPSGVEFGRPAWSVIA